MAEHVPGNITTQVIGVQDPDGGFMQVAVALCRCSCGKIHTAVSEDAFYQQAAAFWLGVKFAQLNKWTELEVPGATTGEDDDG